LLCLAIPLYGDNGKAESSVIGVLVHGWWWLLKQ